MRNVCSAANNLIKGISSKHTEEIIELRRFICLCASPAEQILVAALYDEMDAWIDGKRMIGHADVTSAYEGIFKIVVELQKSIRNYQVDLFIYLARHNYEKAEWGKVVVEVDGHDFHDRTKEQASRDRRRDREMMQEGIKVMRFTGSDVNKHPLECANEIWQHMTLIEASKVFRYYEKAGRLGDLLF